MQTSESQESLNFEDDQLTDILINKSCLTKYEEIGKGNFGKVLRGKLTTDDGYFEVALKTMDLPTDQKSEIKRASQALIEETLIMKNFRHENVLTLIGICLEKNSLPLIVLPFMKNGSLRRFIRIETNFLLVRDLLQFAIDVAKGMSYLSSLRYVHRDLACRNCMLDENLTVKISDFGLTRDIYEPHYYRIKNNNELPIRWLAPECILEFIATIESDVWSFGVLLWELLTRGDQPYPTLVGFQSVLEFVKNGNRMAKPDICPMPVYDLMLACWHMEPTLRPTFNEIIEYIQRIILKGNQEELNASTISSIKYCYLDHYVEKYYSNIGFSVIDIEPNNE